MLPPKSQAAVSQHQEHADFQLTTEVLLNDQPLNPGRLLPANLDHNRRLFADQKD